MMSKKCNLQKGEGKMATKYIGILTSGGDCPGLNAAIRGIGKSALNSYDMQVIGFRDGFRGLMENRTIRLDSSALSGILSLGGPFWVQAGISRTKCKLAAKPWI